jgi:hypothetical protein
VTITGVKEDTSAARVLDALGAAWSTYILYPNPGNQPGFQRAITTLAESSGGGFVFEVGAGAFLLGGKTVPVAREGVDRLARQLFVRDIEAVRIAAPPAVDELAEFFRIISSADGEGSTGLNIQRGLLEANVHSLAVRQRGLLEDDPDEEGVADGDDPDEDEMDRPDRISRVAAMVEDGAGPESVLEQLMDETEGDTDGLITAFVVGYRELHSMDADADETVHRTVTEMISPYWEDLDPARTVRTFVDTYFLLPAPVRAGIVDSFLTDADDEASRIFLDQFSGAELAQLAPHLEEEAFARLIEYARNSAGLPGGMPQRIFALLQSAGEVKEARIAVINRIGELLRAPGIELGQSTQALEKVRGEIHDRGDEENVAASILRLLTECEDRPERFERVLRVWTGRVADAIRAGSFDTAAELLAAVCSDPAYPLDRQPAVDAALRMMLSPELLDVLIERAIEYEGDIQTDGLITHLGGAVVTALIEQLSTEEDATRRKVLIDLLTGVGRGHFAILVKHLNDPRWYMVRNLAIVLGRTGYARAVPPLKRVLGHEDHRVRTESLRALAVLLGEDSTEVLIDALADPHERVRQAAIRLLGSSTAPDVDQRLGAVFLDGGIGAGEVERIARILHDRDTPGGREILEQAASRSLSLSRAQRTVRQAARTVLGR